MHEEPFEVPTDFEIQQNWADFQYYENLELEYEAWLIEQEEKWGVHYE